MYPGYLYLILAASDSGVIGRNNRVPWRLRTDMERFKDLTMYHVVVMGKNTYESLPQKFRPLPERKNIILSSSMQPDMHSGIYVARTVEQALSIAEAHECQTWIIGGAKVYTDLLPYVSEVHLTQVHADVQGDTIFDISQFSSEDWLCVRESEIPQSEYDEHPSSYKVFRRVLHSI